VHGVTDACYPRTEDLGNLIMKEAVDDVVRAPEWAAPTGLSTNPAWRAAALSVGYVALYLVLDRLSFIGALHGIGITPWSPSAGLGMALLVIKGLRYAPLVLAAELLSGATLPMAPISPVPIFLGSLMVIAGYTGGAAMLRHAGLQSGIRRGSDVVKLLIVTMISSGLVASGFVASYAAAEVVPWSEFGEAGFHFWIGDAIGIVVLLPPLLLLHERIKQRAPPAHGNTPFRIVEAAAQAASIVAALAAVFSGIGGDHPLGLFYLLFLPLIWIATRHGLPAASLAVLAIQMGLIAGLEIQGHSEPTLRAFQLLMFALAATGLMLGAVVSERRRLALALGDSEGLRTAILNTVPDGVLTVDARGRIQSINPAVERLFSCPSHRLIGHDVSKLLEEVPDLLPRLKLAARSPASNAGCWELDARRGDGSTFPIELSAGRFDLLGAEHYTIVIRDTTPRRNAEARYRQHQAELAHVSRVSLAGEMAAGLAHELSQPLTAITAYARGCLRLLAGSAPEPARLHEGVAEVVQQAERAGDVLDRLREFVRGGEYRRGLTEVEPLIEAALSLTRVEATQQKVEIAARIDPGLPSVLADRVQIEQVLVNLVRNAMEAMEAANSERRSIAVEARRKGNRAIEISVADSGPGVAAEVADTIFDPFVTTKPLGMGMGLSISRSIVESHGGSLSMVRGDRSGAIFIVDLPTVEAEAGIDAG
jgi:two-component system, LuxR family, sensor kinase FixL